MKSRSEIKERIDEVIKEMEKVHADMHYDNILIYSGEVKTQWKYFDEVAHLYWVLEEPLPKALYDLLSART